MPLAPGELIHNRYRIAALLAQGGMGNVYRAWDTALKISVALKENIDSSPGAKEQFNEEATLLARLSHPNLPRVSDYFSMPGQGEYLVMDYIEGEDLDAQLQAASAQNQGVASPIEPVKVLPWILQVCQALAYLHSQPQPVIHRDIKPANIKIRPDGQAILVDFGISKAHDPQLSTKTGARAVTSGYSPPEQYGGAPTDARSDIYALGATLYHLLTGVRPPESVQRVASSAGGLSLRQLNPRLSPAVEQVVIRAMATAKERRYQTAQEMGAALAAAVPGQIFSTPGSQAAFQGAAAPAPTKPPTPLPPVRRQASQPVQLTERSLSNSWPLLLVGAVAVLALVVVGMRLASRPPPQPPAVSTPVAVLTASSALPASLTPALEAPAKAAGEPIPALVPTLIATPTLPDFPRRLSDAFPSKQNDWFTGIENNLSCWIAGGRYTCQSQPGAPVSKFQWLERYPLGDNFVLAADVWPGEQRPPGLGDSNAGLIFRSSEAGRYLFSVRNDGFYRFANIQTEPANWLDLIPWTRSPAIQPGQDNRLLVSASGTQYDFFINGQFIASIDDDLWQAGYPGLHLFAAPAEGSALVEFDNFELFAP